MDHELTDFAVRPLTPRQREVLRARYGGGSVPATFGVVAAALDISAPRAAQLCANALRRLVWIRLARRVGLPIGAAARADWKAFGHLVELIW